MNQLIIGDKSTLNDWGIFLSSFSVGSAEPKTLYVDIPGGDGSIDLSEALTGSVAYKDRQVSATFTLLPPREDWNKIMDEIRSYAHGQKLIIQVPDDEEHYFIGRIKIGDLIIDGSIANFRFEAACEPYRYSLEKTSHNFVVGSEGILSVLISNAKKRAVPTITVNNETQFEFGSIIAIIPAGTSVVSTLALAEGDNAMIITAIEGTNITIEYQEGVL